jgi:endonuclease YncB( thermonuclease family)
VPQTYGELRRAVAAVMIKGQQEIDQARVRTYWETGRLIREHGLLFKERADYGAKTILRLGADLKVDRSVLYRCVRFVECFPILARRPQLAWAHYRVLIPVADAAERQALAREAIKHGWNAAQLEDRIRPLRLVDPAPAASGDSVATPIAQLLTPGRGTPGLHRIVDRGEGLAVDLGFKLYRGLPTGTKLAAGDIVRIAGDGSVRRVEEATKADLFYYAATLRRVIDGDTLVVMLEVAPEIFVELKLRLRGLDCPEMGTPEGKAAKRFVDALVGKATAVTINTTKPDKYDRYLADVFLATDAGELFLNNELLVNGQAVRKDAWQFRDWEPDLVA